MDNMYISVILLLVLLFILYNYSSNKHYESFDIGVIHEPFVNNNSKHVNKNKTPINKITCPDGKKMKCSEDIITCYSKCPEINSGKLMYIYIVSKGIKQTNIPTTVSKTSADKKWIIQTDLTIPKPLIHIDLDPMELKFKRNQVYVLQFQCKSNIPNITEQHIRDIVYISQAENTITNTISITKHNKIFNIQFEFTIVNETKPLTITINAKNYVQEASPFHIGNIYIYSINKLLDNIPIHSNDILFYLCTLLDQSYKKQNAITTWNNISDYSSTLYNSPQPITFKYDKRTSWNNSNGLIINNNSLIGPDAHLLDLKQLTNLSIMWFMAANEMNNAQFINIDAGAMTGLQIWFRTNDQSQLEITVKLKKNTYVFSISGYTNEMMYILTISGNDINLYANGTNIYKKNNPKNEENSSITDVSITNKEIVLNKNKDCNIILYTFSMFKRSLLEEEVIQLKKIYDIQFSFLTDPSISSKIFKQSILKNPDLSTYIGLSEKETVQQDNHNLLDSFYDQNIIGYSNNPTTGQPYFIKNNKCKVTFDNKEDICYTYDIHKENMDGDNINKVGKCNKLHDKEEYKANCCKIPLSNIQTKICGINKCSGGENVLDDLQSMDNIYSITYEKLPNGKIIKRIKKKNKKKCKKD
jgi:hypothetical protein